MRALEGSGPAGLAGMGAASAFLVRPLLAFAASSSPATRGARAAGLDGSGQQDQPPALLDSLRPAPVDPPPAPRGRCQAAPARPPTAARDRARLGPGARSAARPRFPSGRRREFPLLPPRSRPMIQPWRRQSSSPRHDAPVFRWDSARASGARSVFCPKAASGTEVRWARDGGRKLAFGRLRIVPGAAGPAAAALALEGRSGEHRWGDWRISWRPEAAPAAQKRVGRTAWFEAGALVVRPWVAGRPGPPAGGDREPAGGALLSGRPGAAPPAGILAGLDRSRPGRLDPRRLPVRCPGATRWSGGASCRC